MRFSEVIGLKGTKDELCGGITNNRIAHAQLFYGSKGSGKLALAATMPFNSDHDGLGSAWGACCMTQHVCTSTGSHK